MGVRLNRIVFFQLETDRTLPISPPFEIRQYRIAFWMPGRSNSEMIAAIFLPALPSP